MGETAHCFRFSMTIDCVFCSFFFWGGMCARVPVVEFFLLAFSAPPSTLSVLIEGDDVCVCVCVIAATVLVRHYFFLLLLF